VREVLRSWEKGELSRGCVLDTIVGGLDRQNIEEVVDALPDEWRQQVLGDFRERSTARSPDELINVVGGVFTWEHESDASKRQQMQREHEAEQERERQRYWNVTLPAIRWWLETHESR
jgi:hypothetical protein